jgi:hypothetical protein
MGKRNYPTNRRRLPGREAYIVTALRRKLGELKGLAAKGDNGAPEAIEHVTATLLLFNPSEDVAAIAPIRPYRLHRTRWMSAAFAVLRKEARPMTGREIAYRVMEAHNLDPSDFRRMKSIECGLHAVLERLEGDAVVRVGAGRPKRWRLTTACAD